jgi:hypothetical protein
VKASVATPRNIDLMTWLDKWRTARVKPAIFR